MKDKKQIALDLLDTLQVLDLKPEEAVEVVQEAIKRFNLTVTDCFPNADVSLFMLTVKGFVRNLQSILNSSAAPVAAPENAKVKKTEDALPPTSSEVVVIEDENGVIGISGAKNEAETFLPGIGWVKTPPPCPVEIPVISKRSINGYSKNGRKFGRPRKNPLPETIAEEQSCQGKVAIEIKDSTVDVLPLQETEEEIIESLKMGKEYSLNILYRWNDRFVVSNRIMTEGNPLGVIIPYPHQALKFSKFVLYYTDEIYGLTIADAQSYARNRIPAYEGQKWEILDSWQIKAAKLVLPELNVILAKIGGKVFDGKYRTCDEGTYSKEWNKVRYSVNVK